MDTPSANGPLPGDAARRVAQRMLVIAENRFQLLMVEAGEERERILLAVWLTLGMVAFGLLAGIAFTILIAIALWEHSPVIALLVMAALYALAAGICYRRLVRLWRDWQTFPETLGQLKKDRECLEKTFI